MTELGMRLKDKREEIGISIDELQKITKIQKRYLIAIEEGNYSIMPGQFYARAFIKSYAEAVGLDPDVIFDQFSSEIPKTVSEEVPENLPRAASKQQPAISLKSSKFLSILPKLLAFILIIGVAVAIYMFMLGQDVSDEPQQESPNTVESDYAEGENEPLTDDSEEEQPLEPEQSEEEGTSNEEPVNEVEQQLVQLNTENSGTTPLTEYELLNTDVFNVELTASETGRSYVGIENAIGNSFYAKELRDGNQVEFDFTAENTIELNIGNSNDITITINDEPFTFPYETAHQKVKIIYKKNE